MKVKAVKTGFYGGDLHNEGDLLEIKYKSELGSWMKPVVDKRPVVKKPLVEKPSEQ